MQSSSRSPYFPRPTHFTNRPESITHAVNRMRDQGYTDAQITGQVRQWHPDWNKADVAARIVKNVQYGRATGAQGQRAAAIVGANDRKQAPQSRQSVTKGDSRIGEHSTKPYFPGQKPDHYIGVGRGGGVPVYAYGKRGTSSDLKTVLGAPAKGQTPTQSQAALSKFSAQNHPVGQRIIQGLAEAVPGVALAKGIRDNRFGVNTIASEALNDVSSLLPAGKAAGILGFGVKALRGARRAEKVAAAAKVGEKVTTQVPRTAEDARAQLAKLETHYNEFLDKFAGGKLTPSDMAEQRAINTARGKFKRQQAGRTVGGKLSGASGFKRQSLPKTLNEERRLQIEQEIHQIAKDHPELPAAQKFLAFSDKIDELHAAIGKHEEQTFLGGKSTVSFGTKTVETTVEKTPSQKIQEGLRGARVQRGRQEAGYSAERAKRAGIAEQAMQTIGGIEGHAAAKRAIRGELPKVKFSGFGELTPDNLEQAFRTVQQHPHLMPYQKIRVNDALQTAVEEGKVPTRSDLTLIEHVFGKDLSGTFKDQQKLSLWSKAIEALNVPRSLMASFDVSAPFRQGLVVGARHPRIFFKNFAPMFKSLGSERAYRGVMEDIVRRPSFPMMQEAKLALTDFEHGLAGQEEQFIGKNYAEHIPIVGRGVRGSGRAYTAFLNKTRADTFDHLIRVAQGQGQNVQDEKFLRSLGSYINAATGRGTYGSKALEQALPVMNAVMFSPRLLASRFNFLNPAWYVRQDPFVRKQALRAALQTIGAGSTVAGLATLGGAKVGMDPRNADFGKVRLGNSRFDIWGGFQQPVRLVAQLVSGKVISSTTGKTLHLGPEGPGNLSRKDIVERFAANKLGPAPSYLYDYLSGGSLTGHKFNPKAELASRMVPLLMQDARDLYNEHHGGLNGIEAAMAGYGVGAFGVGLQTYRQKTPKAKRGSTSTQSPYFGSAPAGGSSPYFAGTGSSGSSPYFGR